MEEDQQPDPNDSNDPIDLRLSSGNSAGGTCLLFFVRYNYSCVTLDFKFIANSTSRHHEEQYTSFPLDRIVSTKTFDNFVKRDNDRSKSVSLNKSDVTFKYIFGKGITSDKSSMSMESRNNTSPINLSVLNESSAGDNNE